MQVGASPRGSLALLKLSRGRAALAGRDFVTPEDVKAVAVPALAHRLSLRPELWVQRLRPEDIVAEPARPVPTPARPRPTLAGRVKRAATPKLGAYTALGGPALLAALVLGRPELAALAAPFAARPRRSGSRSRRRRASRRVFELDRERQVAG